MLDNPVIIQRPGQYRITLAQQLNRAQNFFEQIVRQFTQLHLPNGHGSNVTSDDGSWYVRFPLPQAGRAERGGEAGCCEPEEGNREYIAHTDGLPVAHFVDS